MPHENEPEVRSSEHPDVTLIRETLELLKGERSAVDAEINKKPLFGAAKLEQRRFELDEQIRTLEIQLNPLVLDQKVPKDI